MHLLASIKLQELYFHSQIIFSTAPRQCTTAGSGSDTVTSEQSSGSDSQEIPPAMSEAALKRIRGDSPLEAHKLEQVGILISLDCYLISSNHDNYYL